MIIQGDCVEKMRELDEASVDAIVTDPPYGLEFMGKEWDSLGKGWNDRAQASQTGQDKGDFSWFGGNVRPRYGTDSRAMQEWHQAWATEALRVLKPGGHLLAFGGTRTYHRLACAVEDAGFEIRDSLIWLYGSGFPKSLDVSKAIDKANGRKFEDRYALGRHIRERREALGLSRKEVNRRFGYVAGCERWEGQASAARVPTLADWKILRAWLGLSETFLPLVERFEAERRKVGEGISGESAGMQNLGPSGITGGSFDLTAPATPEAAQWEGWGTALKPSHEPIVVARKPLVGTVAANVLEHGTGALNVDGCRIEGTVQSGAGSTGFGADREDDYELGTGREYQNGGRWPSNVVLSHLPECEQVGVRKVKGTGERGGGDLSNRATALEGGDRIRTNHAGYADPGGTETIPAYECAPGCPVAALDAQSGELHTQDPVTRAHRGGPGVATNFQPSKTAGWYDDRGGPSGASRFFYTAKASRAERNAGLDGFEERQASYMNTHGGNAEKGETWHPIDERTGQERDRFATQTRNVHPTVKPIDLMRWLVRLVTPPGGCVCDPFTGSGTTGIAAHLEGFEFIGIEREAEYVAIAEARIAWWAQFPGEQTTEILIRNGLSERLEREHDERGQIGLFK